MLQTTIYYNHDSIVAFGLHKLKASIPHAAREAAKTILLDGSIIKPTFAEYDEQDNESKEWPYGEDVLIYAVAETGENFRVSVKPQPHSHTATQSSATSQQSESCLES